jgi:hypothetical protein
VVSKIFVAYLKTIETPSLWVFIVLVDGEFLLLFLWELPAEIITQIYNLRV